MLHVPVILTSRESDDNVSDKIIKSTDKKNMVVIGVHILFLVFVFFVSFFPFLNESYKYQNMLSALIIELRLIFMVTYQIVRSINTLVLTEW